MAKLTGRVTLKLKVLFKEHCFVDYCKVNDGNWTGVKVVMFG